jgi:aminoglycoside phosphotransferase (APT) family kinase protein
VRRQAVPSKPPRRPPSRDAGAPADDELREELREALAAVDAGEPITIARRRSEYRSSFPLEELSVGLAHGGELRLAFKRLEWEELSRDGRLAKPRFLFDAAREAAVYSTLLPAGPAGPPRYLGSTRAGGRAGCWLFVEWVEGRELYQVGELSEWVAVARWLGEFHTSLAPALDGELERASLLVHDAPYLRRWIERARGFARGAGGAPEAARFLDWLTKRYDAVLEAMLELPSTVIHGDFNASNVLVSGSGEALRVAPVDWELAGAGPGLSDLAALISGGWTEGERERIVDAYAAVDGLAPFSARQLLFARLQLAIQWLGWAPPDWAAPEAHRHDWLAEASALAQRLEL